jgi:carbamate kinase
MTEKRTKLAVVAIGGNSLISDAKHVSVEDQQHALRETASHLADMIEAGWDLAIGHGNGPQVGFILRRSEIAAKVEDASRFPSTSAERTAREPLAKLQQALQK